MAKKKNSVQKTAARMVIDVLKNNGALTPDTAIDITKFRKIKLTSEVIGYTIGNLMQDDVVMKTDDDRFYYSHENYRKLEKKVNRVYWLLIAVPAAVLGIFVVVKYFNEINSFISGFIK